MKKIRRLLRHDWPLHFALLFTNWLPDNVIFIRVRGMLAQPFFGSCGKGLELGRNTCFYDPSTIHIGNHVYIAYGCWFNGNIQIHNESIFGPYCILASETHTKNGHSFRFGGNRPGQIVVGKGCWLGAHSIIVGNGHLGDGSILAANSTLTGVAEANSLYAGNPSKKIKDVS